MVGKFTTSETKTKKKATANYEGGLAYEMDAPNELYSRVGTCLVKEPKFYGKPDEELQRILDLITEVARQEPELILQLAAFARNELHLRSVPIVLLGEASLNKYARALWRRYAPTNIKRADELCEIIGYLQGKLGALGNEKEGTMIPNSLLRGLKEAIHTFSAYQLAKYDRNDATVSMKDLIRLIHPKPRSDEESNLYKKILKDELESADTWEVLISGKGSTKANWEKASKKMPIMALLRNLRNLLDNNVSAETINYIVGQLTDEAKILNSKQFPFRFLSAYRATEQHESTNTGKILTALDESIRLSVKNLSMLDGTTAVFGDNSGSMDDPISDKSQVARRDVAAILGAIASVIAPDNICGVFGQSYARVNFSQRQSILHRAEKMSKTDVGHATYGWMAIDDLISHKIEVKRIMLFSDMQCYNAGHSMYGESIDEKWQEYKAKINPNAFLYSFDLAGYGTTQVPEDDPHVLTIAGWSESIFKYIPFFERERKTVMAAIRGVNPKTYYITKKEQEDIA